MPHIEKSDPADAFPCPFCRGNHVVLSGGGQTFLHYHCSECAEVWTAMTVRQSDTRQPREPLPSWGEH